MAIDRVMKSLNLKLSQATLHGKYGDFEAYVIVGTTGTMPLYYYEELKKLNFKYKPNEMEFGGIWWISKKKMNVKIINGLARMGVNIEDEELDKMGWIEALKEDGSFVFKKMPEKYKKDPAILNLAKEMFMDLIEANIIDYVYEIPKEILDKTIALMLMKKNPKEVYDNLPENFKNDPDILNLYNIQSGTKDEKLNTVLEKAIYIRLVKSGLKPPFKYGKIIKK
jgi:hypothetical protein